MKSFKGISSVVVLVATLAIFLAGGNVFAAEQSSKVNVLSCEQLANGIKVKKSGVNGGKPYTLSNEIKNAGHDYRKYTFTCVSPTQYKVTWQEYGVAAPGTLTIDVAGEAPFSINMLLGDVKKTLAIFKFTASNKEDIIVNKIVLGANLKSASAPYALSNLRLYDYDTELPIGVAANLNQNEKNGTYVSVTFDNLNWEVKKNLPKLLIVKADVASLSDSDNASLSNAAAQLAILPDYSDQPGIQLPVGAYGKQSGNTLVFTSFSFKVYDGSIAVSTATNGKKSQLVPNNGYVRASEFVFYRSKLDLSFANDTPSGVAAPSKEQLVGKFVAKNGANIGNYSAVIKKLNFSIWSTIKNNAGSVHLLKVYKDALGTTPLATVSFTGDFTDTALADSDMTDVEIAAGSSTTFYVTLDTTAAAPNDTLGFTLTKGPSYSNDGPNYGVEWSDGVTNDIVANSGKVVAPLKIFTY